MNQTNPAIRLPAEWEPQSAVMLTWPHAGTNWAPVLSDVEPVFFAIARAVLCHQQLLIVCPSAEKAAELRAVLGTAAGSPGQLVTVVAASNDTWARDHGPITVLARGVPRILDFHFNGWGNKYPSAADDAITSLLDRQGTFAGTAVERIELVLEGGSIDSDGAGTILTTASCLLNTARNPHQSRAELEQKLCALFGATRLIWLEHGEIEGDDTDGHIDMLARFSDAQTIVYQSCDEPAYSGFAALQAMHGELQRLRTLDDTPYRLVPLPWPQPKFDQDGTRMPASYANFLVINGAVLLPGYDDPADEIAAQRLHDCFPDREIITIHCLPLIQQHGSLHCLTMQFPHDVVLQTKP